MILVLNSGSSSIKYRLFDDTMHALDRGLIEHIGEPGGPASHLDALQSEAERLRLDAPDLHAIGHRVVHGGSRFVQPTLLTDEVVAAIKELTPLAPLHNPPNLAGIEVARQLRPDVPQVAIFDTAFHASIPDETATYALPHEWNRRWGLRRYGFHGLSHSYVSRRAAEILGQPIEMLRMVSCHLGAGASLAAVEAGRSVDTTMGFTPLAGLVMATRTGSLDPGLVLWLQMHSGISADKLSYVLEHESGLKGLSGGSGDMREILRDIDDDPRARLAFEVYVHRLRREIAAMTASMGGLDVLVFTGGVGEHSAPVRAAAAEGLHYFGVDLDPVANDAASGDAEISAPDALVRTVVVTAREEVEIANGARSAIDQAP